MATEKQIIYLSKLCDSDNPFATISSTINRVVDSWDQLKQQDIRYCITKLSSQQKLSDKQKSCLRNNNLGSLSKTLNRVINSLDELTVKDFQNILYPNSRFNLYRIERPIEVHEYYEIGYQESEYCEPLNDSNIGMMKYIKFFDVMMLDFDNIKYEDLKERLLSKAKYTYRIYETHNGFHVFIVSDLFPHNLKSSALLMFEFGCDKYYVLFANKYGYKIRLSKKKNRNEQFLARYIETIGNNKNQRCMEMINIHDSLIDKSLS